MILNINDVGPPVLACQNALASALGARSTNSQNGTYGRGLAGDVKIFRTDVLHVPVVADGLMLDDGTINALKKYMNSANLTKLGQPLKTNVAYDAIMFNQGDEGPPVGAMQNALFSALGSEGQSGKNAKNASYGSNTALDVALLGESKNFPIPADGRGLNYIAWQILLGYMNDANRNNAGKPLKTDVKAGQFIFDEGDEGPPIAAMQAAIYSILGSKATNARNGVYGSKTVDDLLLVRGKGNITPVGYGTSCDKLTWDWLYSYMNESYQAMAKQPLTVDVSKDGDPSAPTGQELKNEIAGKGIEAYNSLHNVWVYNQYRAMASSLWDAFAEDHSDCSSFVTLVYKDCGAPDPNKRDYDGYGYTGTLWPNGKDCKPENGALAFYGGSSGNDTEHVALVTDGGTRVVSFGHTPIEYYSSVAYRSDYRGCKSFV